VSVVTVAYDLKRVIWRLSDVVIVAAFMAILIDQVNISGVFQPVGDGRRECCLT
jgi:hypothetical protein